MDRFAIEDLREWKKNTPRKPLIVRGARKVGKTHLVRQFAAEQYTHLLEINFERHPEIDALFASKDPRKILQLLELQYNTAVEPGQTLIFLDEIQAAPQALASLRYFSDELPALAIIAASSLLDFALATAIQPVPMGLISQLHLGPMRFEEFLLAIGREKMGQFIKNYHSGDQIPQPVHTTLMGLVHIFMATGGMPEAVSSYCKGISWQACEAVKHSLWQTLQDDFHKYGQHARQDRLTMVLNKIPLQVGKKFRYVGVDRKQRANEIAKALTMLCRAKVAYPVYHSDADGLPLAAMVSKKKFKVYLMDVGLYTTASGLSLIDYERADDIMEVNDGAVCRQFVAQHLLYARPSYQTPELFYWTRDKKNSAAAVDFIFVSGNRILPVEVKPGKDGSLKSLHLFVREKACPLGVRFHSQPPSLIKTKTAVADGDNVDYLLLSLPLYLVGQLPRILTEIGNGR